MKDKGRKSERERERERETERGGERGRETERGRERRERKEREIERRRFRTAHAVLVGELTVGVGIDICRTTEILLLRRYI